MGLFVFFTETIVTGEELSKSVLYINSYHHGYPWSDTILDGIREGLGRSTYKIELQVEYLDSKKYYNNEPVLSSVYKLHEKKFGKENFDVVIVSDDDAFRYALKYRSNLFPGVPIVFCGVNYLSSAEETTANITGIVENFDLEATIEVVLKIHPEKRRMVVVGDNSTAGQTIKSQIESSAVNYQDRVTVDYWMQLDLDEVQVRVKRLPDDTFLYIMPYFQVSGDYFHTAEEVMEAIYSHSKVPIYTSWEFLLGHGAVGGNLVSGLEHGREASRLALDILNGVEPSDIPIVIKPMGLYLFDYLVMDRLGIDQSVLPEGSTIINAPNPFYQLSIELFWTIVVSFLLLFVVLLFLSFNMVARREVERTMKDQLTFQETLINTIPLLVSWKDEDGKYVGANQSFAEFFGLDDISEVVDKTTSDVVADEEYVQWSIESDESVVQSRGELRRVRKRITGGDGEFSWLELNKVPLRDRSGTITGVLTTAENITREQNLEYQLLQSQKMEAIGTLAGGIAHDFNNILTSIINSTELAITDLEPGTQTSKDLNRVLKAARRGSRVVKQILTFSRPSQEGFRSTDLEAVVSEVITFMEVSLPGNIEMKSYVSPQLEEILADPTQLHQAIMNLCTNAFHELKASGGEIQLGLEEVTLDKAEAGAMNLVPGTFIKISVADNGPGIDASIIDKIFDPFFSSKDKTEGSGLGLTVVLGIVKNHNGGVKVGSEVGEGTNFELYLPKIIIASARVDDRQISDTRKGGYILFVEDDIDQLQTTPRILRSMGYQVDPVGDSREAVELIKADPYRYDMIITDYDMAGINGVDLVNQIEEFGSHLPVVLVSGREDAATAAAGVSAIKHVIIKPYEKKELTVIMNSILRSSHPG